MFDIVVPLFSRMYPVRMEIKDATLVEVNNPMVMR